MGSALPALRVRKGASKAEHPAVAARELAQSILQPDAALYLFYCAPGYDLCVLEQAIRESFGARPVIACTTAGEITPLGYLEGTLRRGDRAAVGVMQELSDASEPSCADAFGFLLADGPAMQEEALKTQHFVVSGQKLVDNEVVGFATGGEQSNGMHVNQTFTGVALGSAAHASAG